MRFKVGDKIILPKGKSGYAIDHYGHIIKTISAYGYVIQWDDGMTGSGTCDACDLYEEPNDIMKKIL